MLGTQDFLMFVVAGLLLNMTPGADTLYIVGKSASGGAKSGAVAALGIGAGCLVHTCLVALGLAALMASSSDIYIWVKYLGAAYLFYLGFSMIFISHQNKANNLNTSTAINQHQPLEQTSLSKVFWGGFFTNALNPKVALFFLAFLPQFVAPTSLYPALSMLFLGGVFAFNGTIWNVGMAWSTAVLSNRLKASEKISVLLKRSCGALFIYFGIKLLRS